MLRSLILSAAVTALPLLAFAQAVQPGAPVQATPSDFNTAQNFEDLLTALRGLDAHGLNPSHYRLAELEAMSAPNAARNQLAMTAWKLAASHMLFGKLDPLSVEPDWTAKRRTADLSAQLQLALTTETVVSSLDAIAPKQAGYAALKSAYSKARSDTASQTKISAGAALKPGQSGARVGELQTRLGVPATGTFDAVTESAVRIFQREQGLDHDGIVGTASLAALNRGGAEQLDALRVNLERWRWLPDDLGRRHVRVNIAGFSVTTWQDAKAVRTHLGIVGRRYRETPVFSDEIEYAVINPWWETPRSLTIRDKLPAFRRDPSAVKRLGFQILDSSGRAVDPDTIDWANATSANFPYRIRQAPGELNALGEVKIIFPNAHNVYLHDTPTRGLFAKQQRAFSSGCIRTQDPIALTKWLLEETPAWPADRVDSVLTSKKETRADLAARVPVHVLYFTVVAEDGVVRFLDDIYERDAAVLAGLRTTK